MDVREAAHERMQQELTQLLPETVQQPVSAPQPIPLDQHHRIAVDESNKIYLSSWLASHADDPAFKVSDAVAYSPTFLALTSCRIFYLA
jgi:hypothetical protein